MDIMKVVILSMLGESVYETTKMVWQNGKYSIDKIGAMIVGLLIAVGTGLDLFAIVGIPTKIPFLGMILTGILISRGANFIHDILATISSIQQNNKL